MSDNMNSRIFARKWLEREGLFDKDSDYDGWLGEKVMEVWNFIAEQGHSGGSASRVFAILQAIYEAYEMPDHPIWQEYWASPEGQALIAQVSGKASTSDLNAIPAQSIKRDS